MQIVSLAVADGYRDIEASVYGNFAIHSELLHDGLGGYKVGTSQSLTHVPTGKSIMTKKLQSLSLAKLIKLAKSLDQHQFTDITDSVKIKAVADDISKLLKKL